MSNLTTVQSQADQLTREDQIGLLAHLIHSLEGAPSGADDQEVTRREEAMDSGEVSPVSHEDFLAQARPNRK